MILTSTQNEFSYSLSRSADDAKGWTSNGQKTEGAPGKNETGSDVTSEVSPATFVSRYDFLQLQYFGRSLCEVPDQQTVVGSSSCNLPRRCRLASGCAWHVSHLTSTCTHAVFFEAQYIA